MTLQVKQDKAENIKSYIFQRIGTGEYVDRIPSLNQLAGYFNVNIKTAKRAVTDLEQEGFLYSHKGKGTFVNQKNLQPMPFLFIGREDKEISGEFSSVLSSCARILDINYRPYTFLLPSEERGRNVPSGQLKDFIGILIEGGLINVLDLNSINVPVIQLHSTGKATVCPAVITDVENGMIQALDYLHSLGHRKLAYFGPNPKISTQCENLEEKKRNCFIKHIEELGMITCNDWCPETYYRVESGYQSAKQVLSSINRPTAIICVNDEVALGVLNVCDELGLRVPTDISIIGFDDRTPAIMRKPFLSTVRVDFKRIAIEGIKLMQHCIENKNYSNEPKNNIVIPTQLIVRGTTGKVADE